MFRISFVAISFVSALLVSAERKAFAAPPEVASILPESTIAYVEVPDPDRLVETVLGHPVMKRMDEFPPYKALLRSPQFLTFRLGLGYVETRLKATWQKSISYVAGDGIYAAFDPKTEGFIILTRASDDARLQRGFATIVKLAKENKDIKDQLKEDDYRGHKVYKLNEAYFTSLKHTVIVTNKSELGKQVLDRLLDGNTNKSLGESAQFQAAKKLKPQALSLWSYIDVKTFRESNQANDLFSGRTNNPLLEIIWGGLASSLKELPFATASFELGVDESRLMLRTPQKSEWIPEFRQFYFGSKAQGRSPSLLKVKDEIFSLSLFRDFSDMWLRAGDLYDENVNDQIAAAESGLATFFSGRDFGEDILASFKPGARLVVSRQSFKGRPVVPATKLPQFALEVEFKDTEMMRPVFRRIFQSLIGFLNVLGAMEGQPQLDQDIIREEGRMLVTSYYLPEIDKKEDKEAPIQFNFSPTVAFVNNHFVISSTRELADELSRSLSKLEAKRTGPNTIFRANGTSLKAILRDNREPLIAQNMLEDGNSRAEAEAAIDLILEIVGLFSSVDFDLDVVDETLQAQLKIQYTEPDKK